MKPFQFTLRTLFVVLTVVALLLGLGIWAVDRVMHDFFHAVMVGKTGPVSSPEDWPKPLKELCDDAERAEWKVSVIQVHCLCQGFDPEYVWRMESTPGLLDYLKQKWELSRVTEPMGVVRDGRSRLSGERVPPWWNPLESENAEFYVCKRTLAREGSDRFQVAVDKKGGTIFVHYSFIF